MCSPIPPYGTKPKKNYSIGGVYKVQRTVGWITLLFVKSYPSTLHRFSSILTQDRRKIRIGVDARHIKNETAIQLINRIKLLGSILVYPKRNLVDSIWKQDTQAFESFIYIHPIQYAGMSESDDDRYILNRCRSIGN